MWAPARAQLVQAMASAGLDLESGHWDWRNKVGSVGSNRLRLFAVEYEGEVQGLMALATQPRPSILPPEGSVVYVDYLESAPWNLRQPIQSPRFLGVGTILIGEAVRLSVEQGFGGRVGLHALPQAERFYSERCRMIRHGPDRTYYDLVYFEYPEGVAPQWLIDIGMGS
jgi:hypothetical protein